MNKSIKTIGCTILSGVIGINMVPTCIFAHEDEHPTEKIETVFTVLNGNGSVDSETVSSWIHDEDGIHDVQEKLTLKDVENLKGKEKPEINGDEYTWNTTGNDVYYQGTSKQQLPVRISIEYTLNGKSVTLDELENKSGHLKMKVNYTPMISEDIMVGGKKVTIHPAYVLGGAMFLEDGKIENVKCKQGKIVDDGNRKVLVFANIPGLKGTMEQAGLEKVVEELNLKDYVELEADVKKFDSASMMMGMSNELSLKDLDSMSGASGLGELTSGVEALYAAGSQLQDGANQLNNGAGQLQTGIQPLVNAAPQIDVLNEGAAQLSQGSHLLKEGVEAYTSGVTKLNKGNKQLYGILDGEQTALMGSTDLAKGCDDMNKGLTALNEAVQNMDSNQIAKLIEESQGKLSSMQGVVTQDMRTLTSMQSSLKESVLPLVGNLSSSIQKLNESIEAINQQVLGVNKKIDEKNSEITNKNEEFSTNKNKALESLNSAIDSLNATINGLNGPISTLQSTISTLSAEEDPDQGAISAAQSEMESLESQVRNLSAQRDALVAQRDNLAGITNLNTVGDLDQIDLTDFATQVTTIKGELGGLSKALQGTINQLSGLDNDLHDALVQLDELQKCLMDGMNRTGMFKNIGLLKEKVNALRIGSIGLKEGSAELKDGITLLAQKSENGVNLVNAGSEKLQAQNANLLAGSEQLEDGIGQIAGKKKDLEALKGGMIQLDQAVSTLKSGTQLLSDGENQFMADGLSVLKEKVDLTTGELSDLQFVLSKIQQLNDKNMSFSGSPEGAQSTTRFVFKLKE